MVDDTFYRRDIDRIEARVNNLEQRLDNMYVRRDLYDSVIAGMRQDVADIKGRSIWLFRAVVFTALAVAGNLIVALLLKG